jgi:hypothetical protein
MRSACRAGHQFKEFWNSSKCAQFQRTHGELHSFMLQLDVDCFENLAGSAGLSRSLAVASPSIKFANNLPAMAPFCAHEKTTAAVSHAADVSLPVK